MLSMNVWGGILRGTFWDLSSLALALVVNAEQGFANFTVFGGLVNELVQWVKVGRSCAVHVVPPIANEILLVENGSVGAQK